MKRTILTASVNTPGALFRRTGAVAETYSRVGFPLANLAGSVVSGQQLFVAVQLFSGQVVSQIGFWAGTTAAVTPTNQFFGLWSSARAQLRLTADDTTTAWGASAEKVLTLSSPYTITADGLYYLSVLVAAATPPTLTGVASTGVPLAATPVLNGRDTTNTGITTPASAPATAAAFASSGSYPYAYVK